MRFESKAEDIATSKFSTYAGVPGAKHPRVGQELWNGQGPAALAARKRSKESRLATALGHLFFHDSCCKEPLHGPDKSDPSRTSCESWFAVQQWTPMILNIYINFSSYKL
jgi:hypothetical protein